MIKLDMSMPESCREYPLRHGSFCEIIPQVPSMCDVSTYIDTRSEHCPLMEHKPILDEAMKLLELILNAELGHAKLRNAGVCDGLEIAYNIVHGWINDHADILK